MQATLQNAKLQCWFSRCSTRSSIGSFDKEYFIVRVFKKCEQLVLVEGFCAISNIDKQHSYEVEQHNLSTIPVGANKNDKNVGVLVGNVNQGLLI
jgi:hypothetical protein